VIVMMALRPDCYAGALVVVTAWQATLLLSTTWSAALIAAQTIGVFIVLQWFSGEQFGWAIAAIYLAYEVFAAATAWVAKNETAARAELLRANAELRATQLLLAQSSRIGERLRISRDLHDVLGHDLTALALHLEVARNSPGHTGDEVGAARDIAKGLLTKVREVVSLMRATDRCDLPELLGGLASDGPNLKVHLSVAEDLDATDAGRAHALLRCLQEVITNARKHSGAANLWVDVKREGASLVTTARDDGCGLARKGRQTGIGKRGHGLKGIEERLSEFGGTLILADEADKGFALKITLPEMSAAP
jgi:signal transduction histidine kinase